MCKPTDLKKDDSPKPRGLKREAEDEIDCEIATSPDLHEDGPEEGDTDHHTDQGEEQANYRNHHLTTEQRLDLQERRARQRIKDQIASLQSTVEHQSTRVIQLEETNNSLMEQIRVLTESKNRLLQMVEVAKNGGEQQQHQQQHGLPRAATSAASIPHSRVAAAAATDPPHSHFAMNVEALFLLNHIQGTSTLSPVGFQGTTDLLLATLSALSERSNESQQSSEQATTYSAISIQQQQLEQQPLGDVLQRYHQADAAAETAFARDLLGSKFT